MRVASDPRQLALEDWWASVGETIAQPQLQDTLVDAQSPAPSPDSAAAANTKPMASLENALRARLRSSVKLSFHENRRTIVSVRANQGNHHVRLHRMFQDAPSEVVDALTRYIVLRDRNANRVIHRFVEGIALNTEAKETKRVAARGHANGRVYDLEQMLHEVWQSHGPNDCQPDVHIQWGTLGRKQRGQRSIRLGSYSALDKRIRIHPVLDSEFVPRFFVLFVVFHELLHHWLPSVAEHGRQMMHHTEFRKREAQHPQYREALRWEKENIDRLLRHTAKLRREAAVAS